jgi:hypothetical protein
MRLPERAKNELAAELIRSLEREAAAIPDYLLAENLAMAPSALRR